MPSKQENKKPIKLVVKLLSKVEEEDDNFKKRTVLKLSKLLTVKELEELLSNRSEIDEVDLNDTSIDIEKDNEETFDKSYISMKASTNNSTLRRMQESNFTCEYDYNSDFSNISTENLINCSFEVYRQEAIVSLTLIKKHLFLGAIVYNLRYFIEENDETLLNQLKHCHEKTWILKVRYLLLTNFQKMQISPTEVWSKSTLERCHHLYVLYHDNDLIRIPHITRSVDFLMKKRKKFESYIFTDGELNEEGKFWQTKPVFLPSLSVSFNSVINNNNNNENNNNNNNRKCNYKSRAGGTRSSSIMCNYEPSLVDFSFTQPNALDDLTID